MLMDPIGFASSTWTPPAATGPRKAASTSTTAAPSSPPAAANVMFRGPDELARALAPLPGDGGLPGRLRRGHAFGLDHGEASCLAKTASEELRAGTISVVDFYVRLARAESFRTRVQ